MPTGEAELLTAYRDGLLTEKNWCDLKASVDPGKGSNAELARDLASFSVDGGTLIIGLDEKEPDGSPLTPVDLAQVSPERIEQVAAMKVDPPLSVECTQLHSATTAGTGYVLVHVPASPLAPHQVEGKYLGRGDKTKRYLSDVEVGLLFRRRQQWDQGVTDIVTEFVTSDFHPNGKHPHLFIVAQPVTHNTAMCRDLIDDSNISVVLFNLQKEVAASPAVRCMLDGSFPGLNVPPRIYDLEYSSKTADGLRMAPRGIDLTGEVPEQFDHRLDIHEDGGLRFYDAYLGEPRQTLDGRPFAGLFLDRVLTNFREILAVASEISSRYGFAGAWHLGVAVTNIREARPIPSVINRIFPAVVGSHGYTRDQYRQVSRASVLEIQTSPGRVTERVFGRLFRSMATGTPHAFADAG